MAWLDLIARSDSGRWSFAPALIVAGAGMGGIWAPIFDVAMRTIEPRLAGVAGGVLETIQELGGVVASAAIGALLQNRLATALHDQAVQRAAALPPAARPSFVAGFSHAASAGLEVGRGQTGGGLHLPAGLPAGVVQQIQLAAHAVFTHGFVDAMRPSLVVPIAAILVAAVSCFAVRGGTDSKAQEMLWDSEETVA
jgi:hypothetical protein